MDECVRDVLRVGDEASIESSVLDTRKGELGLSHGVVCTKHVAKDVRVSNVSYNEHDRLVTYKRTRSPTLAFVMLFGRNSKEVWFVPSILKAPTSTWKVCRAPEPVVVVVPEPDPSVTVAVTDATVVVVVTVSVAVTVTVMSPLPPLPPVTVPLPPLPLPLPLPVPGAPVWQGAQS